MCLVVWDHGSNVVRKGRGCDVGEVGGDRAEEVINGKGKEERGEGAALTDARENGETGEGLVVEGDVTGVVTVESIEIVEDIRGEIESGKNVQKGLVRETWKSCLEIPKDGSSVTVCNGMLKGKSFDFNNVVKH